jgi:hypothetical protein
MRRCPETALVYSPISWSLHSKGSTSYNILKRLNYFKLNIIIFKNVNINVFEVSEVMLSCERNVEGSVL